MVQIKQLLQKKYKVIKLTKRKGKQQSSKAVKYINKKTSKLEKSDLNSFNHFIPKKNHLKNNIIYRLADLVISVVDTQFS